MKGCPTGRLTYDSVSHKAAAPQSPFRPTLSLAPPGPPTLAGWSRHLSHGFARSDRFLHFMGCDSGIDARKKVKRDEKLSKIRSARDDKKHKNFGLLVQTVGKLGTYISLNSLQYGQLHMKSSNLISRQARFDFLPVKKRTRGRVFYFSNRHLFEVLQIRGFVLISS